MLIFALLVNIGRASADIQDKCSKNGFVALTYDGAPTDHIDKLLTSLKENGGLKVMFHIPPNQLPDDAVKARVKKIHQDGHEIGMEVTENYTAFNDTEEIVDDLKKKRELVKKVIGKDPIYLRSSINIGNQSFHDAIEELGMIITKHNLDSKDSDPNTNKQTIKDSYDEKLNSNSAKSHSFISVHRTESVVGIETTDDILEIIEKAGYKPCNLSQCLGTEGYKPTGKKKVNKKTDEGNNAMSKYLYMVIGVIGVFFILN
eukprot:GHVP01051364.1.p1 GENE.GHVP01051364.1~~GHVP01051364.1.p1  ORF type:complete len:259 (-),score=45.10 GHVP01051364.1:1154-1930(-)